MITCPICGATSHHPDDVRHGYCGRCHSFTSDCAAPNCKATPTTLLGGVAACTEHAKEMQ